ncbi:MAG: lamin tail domain-containing protein [Bacteroidota bacterium]
MKKFIYTVAAAMLIFTGCVKDDFVPEEPQEPASDLTVVINEVMSKDAGSNPDWVELYNTTDNDIDLSGYIINDKENSTGGSVIADGTIITAKGYIVLEDGNGMGESISSGGEWVSLSTADGTVIDKIEVIDMSSNVGLTYGRVTDAGDEWQVNSPTKAASNGNVENTPPILDASELTEFTEVYSVSASDAGGINSVKLVHIVNEGVVTLDMALVDGKYRTTVPKSAVGSTVKYYVIAADNSGLTTVFPENGIETPAEFTVKGGVKELTFSEVQDAATMLYDFTFTATVHYPEQVDEVRVYYLLPGETQDETVDPPVDEKHKVKIPADEIAADGTFNGTITGLDKDTELTYYIRVEYVDGTKTYQPVEEYDAEGNVSGDFNHDLSSTWPTVMVGAIPIAPVNGFSDLAITNEAGADLSFNVKVEYDNGDAQEVKFYYYLNFDNAAFTADPDGYEDANRVSVEADPVPSADNTYDFSIAGLSAGDKVLWYMRAKDGEGEKMYYTFGKTAANFDGDIKDDPTTWHVISKN